MRNQQIMLLLAALVVVELGAAALGETLVSGGYFFCAASHPGAYIYGLVGSVMIISGLFLLLAETIVIIVFGLWVIIRLIRRLSRHCQPTVNL